MRNGLYNNIRQKAISSVILTHKKQHVDISLVSTQDHSISFNQHESGIVNHDVIIKFLQGRPETYKVNISEVITNGKIYVNNISKAD